jgi:hypothetical protein
MKKLFLVLALCAFVSPALTFAEDAPRQRFIREFTGGIMVGFVGTHTFGEALPFSTVTTIAPCLNILTAHTHDHIMYGLNDNTLQTLNGYLLKRNWGVYNFLSKSVVTKDAYGSIGIEKVLLMPNLDFVFYAEIGTNFYGVNSTSIGLVIHPQFSLRRSEGKG